MDGHLEDTKITVVGLGYVGLPTAIAFYEAGFSVCGVDLSEPLISNLEGGILPFHEESLVGRVPETSNRWNLTTDYSKAIPESDIILITVPTPVSENKVPDLSYVTAASRSVLENIGVNSTTIITLESTVYPGVTREVLGGLCEEMSISSDSVILAYSPERISPGDNLRTVEKVARVVGCDNPEVGQYLAKIYSKITSKGCKYVGKLEVAEASKLIENVQRDIDIAFVNELSMILPKIGLDVEEVLSAASSKWNFHRHTPGIGVGGHCIPVDPYYYHELSEKTGQKSLISTSARSVNEHMPTFSSEQIISSLDKNAEKNPRILILGYSYKPETGDTRDTPVRKLTYLLSQHGMKLYLWDPHVENDVLPNWLNPIEDPYANLNYEMVVLATAHKACQSLDWKKLSESCSNPKIYDGRRALSSRDMIAKGWSYSGVGYPEFIL